MRSLTLTVIVFLVFSVNKGVAMPFSHIESNATAAKPETIVKKYLYWYKENKGRLDKFNMVPGISGDSTRVYAVDFNVTEAYLQEIKNSGFVSEKYIDSFREYFQASDDSLKKYPQFDGPAQGFGIDLVFKAHDYFEILDNLQKLKILSKSIDGNKAKLKVQVASIKMVFSLTRSGEVWFIDSLDY